MRSFIPTLLLVFAATFAFSQAGTFDLSFNSIGVKYFSLSGGTYGFVDMEIQPDGKYVVAGHRLSGTNYDFMVGRINSDGSWDNTFGTNGMVIWGASDKYERLFDVDLSGSNIVCIGTSNSQYPNTTRQMIYVGMLTSTGAFASFGVGGSAYCAITNSHAYGYAGVVQNDGKIVVVGHDIDQTTQDQKIITTRFLATGTVDQNYGASGVWGFDLGGTQQNAYDVALAPDGRIVAVGSDNSGGKTRGVFLRLTTSGLPDNTFDGNGIAALRVDSNTTLKELVVLADYRIVACGYSQVLGQPFKGLVLGYKENGSRDSTFGTNGIVRVGAAAPASILFQSITRQPDGKYVLIGLDQGSSPIGPAVARLNSNGSMDLTWNGTGLNIQNTTTVGYLAYNSGKIQSDGKLVVCGSANQSGNPAIARYNTCTSTNSTQTATACQTYTWTQNGNTYTSSGNYTVTYPNAAGCDSSFTLQLTIHQMPNLNVSVNGAVLTAQQTGASYQWINCLTNQPVPGATGRIFTATASGSYKVQITLNSCVGTSACQTVTLVGRDAGIQPLLDIYPSPANDFIQVLSDQPLKTVIILDISGKTVQKEAWTASQTSATVDVSRLVEGIYLIKVETESGMQVKKLVINR